MQQVSGSIMHYTSTRDSSLRLGFREVVESGLSAEGGLFLPLLVPDLSADMPAWSGLPYKELAAKIFSIYAGADLPAADTDRLLNKALARFRHAGITPLVSQGRLHVLELFHGPTYSFKDVALQWLGCLFEQWPAAGGRRTVLGATSGDTGSAAIHGLRGVAGTEVYILFPEGRVSAIQELQMTTVADANIHCLAIRGSFDDCQNLVKECFADAAFKREMSLAAVNSINWSRIMAQIVYYFSGYFQWLRRQGYPYGTPLACAVPTGNFGDVFAGHLARQMGLPLQPLIIASNENDILTRFSRTGIYEMRAVVPTTSPSMDIQISSNFERLLYLLHDGDATRIQALMGQLKRENKFSVAAQVLKKFNANFAAASVDQRECEAVMRELYNTSGMVVDPHTAVGIGAAGKILGSEADVMCLATAHPAKFLPAVEKACAHTFALPAELEQLKLAKVRKTVLAPQVEVIKSWIRQGPHS